MIYSFLETITSSITLLFYSWVLKLMKNFGWKKNSTFWVEFFPLWINANFFFHKLFILKAKFSFNSSRIYSILGVFFSFFFKQAICDMLNSINTFFSKCEFLSSIQIVKQKKNIALLLKCNYFVCKYSSLFAKKKKISRNFNHFFCNKRYFFFISNFEIDKNKNKK